MSKRTRETGVSNEPQSPSAVTAGYPNDLKDGGVPRIGLSLPRADALEKVTGRLQYAADFYSKEMVWAGVKRAGLPHGLLKRIDADRAREMPGVLCILTHKDVPGTNRQGVVRKDQPVLVDDKVRHCGDAVALVLAENREILAKALDLIRVDCEVLPGVFDAQGALKEGAPLVHEDNPDGNVLLKGHLTTGSPSDAAGQCDLIVEERFETSRQEHAYLETECGWAQLEEDGKLVITCSTQTPFRDRMEVCEALGLDLTRLRIVAPYAGGAFGGKDGITVQSLLGLAALHSGGRPVKMWWNREESFLAGTKRHPARMHYRLGAKKDGTLHYLNMEFYVDTGPYDHLGGVVLALALEHASGPYRVPHTDLRGWCVYTNNPIGGAFRGFGVTQVTAALEQMMDILADRLGMDPLALRLKNAVHIGDKNGVGKTLVSSTGLIDCLETLGNHQTWKDREVWKAGAASSKRRGVGMAAVMHASGYGPVVPDYANAKLELTGEGRIAVYCGVVDMGQGNASTNVHIVGALLNQNARLIDLVQPDTDRTLPSGSASASRCTYTFGNALIGAVGVLKERILQRAADLLMIRDKKDLVLVPGMVKHLPSGREISLSKIAEFLSGDERTAVHHFRAPVARDGLGVEENLSLHGLPHTLFSYGAHVAEVEVDEITGVVDVKHYLAISDCGKVINPQIYEQQIHGGIAQGLGFALSESFDVLDGKVLTHDFSTYLIPTAADVPEIESTAVEIYEPTGPFGLKGVGEIATNGPLPAVANAVWDACGVRCSKFPLTAERFRKARDDKRGGGGQE